MKADWRSIVGGGLVLIPVTIFGIFGNAAEMGAIMIAGTLAAAFLNIDKFEKFKAAGFEARLKKTTETADKALVTLENLEAVIEPILINTLSNITHESRLGGMTQNEKDLIRDKCVLVKSNLFSDNIEINKLILQYDNYSKWDAYSKITSHLYGLDNKNCNSNSPCIPIDCSTKAVCDELLEMKNYGNETFPNEKEIYDILEKHDAKIDNELKDIIAKYLHRVKHNKYPD